MSSMVGSRRAIDPKLRSKFDPEVVQLFAKLERTPLRQRRARWWKDAEKHLMCELLDMGGEFWAMCSPLDCSSERFCPPLHMGAHDMWHNCRRLRMALLEAIKAT